MIIDIENWLWKSDFGTFQGPVNRHVYSQNTTKSDPPKKKHNRIDANVQYEKSERPIAILLQTLLHLSRHSKVFLLRPSLFVRNSHKKTRWWASSLFFSSAAKEKKYAHSGVRRTQVGRNAQIGVNGAAGLLVTASSFSTSDGMKWRNPKYNGLETRIFFKK